MYELFAQNNAQAQAFQAGQMVGVVIAMIVSFAIPFGVGLAYGRPILGSVGGVVAGLSALPCGCLLGLPIAGVFTAIIIATSPSTTNRRRDPRDDWDDRDRNDRDFRDDRGDDRRRYE